MQINVDEKLIEQMVKDQVEETVKKRIKEMQSNYTSKGFIEKLIKEVIWKQITDLVPGVEEYIKSEIEDCVKIQLQFEKKVSKKEFIDMALEKILERFEINNY